METAKKIARNVLNLDDDKILENIENIGTQKLLTESIEYIPNKSSIYVFKIVDKNNNQILNS